MPVETGRRADAHLERAARALNSAARVTVLTGAGVSAASGVPTFRGADGLWRSVRAADLATPEAFGRDPALVWEWYDWRRQTIARCAPNLAHHVLASWSLRFPRFTLITQNVDGLHERAGTDGVLRFHGSIWDVECWRRCAGAPARWRDDTAPFPELPPKCPYCGGPLRPGVVWFGEALDPDVVDAGVSATRCDVFLAIGTSAVVHPAAGLIDRARRQGALTLEVNPDPSSDCDVVVAAPAEHALPAIDARLSVHPLELETARLRLVPVLPRDTEALHAVWTDAGVRRYLWDDRVISLDTAAGITAASARDFAEHGFGLWSLVTRVTPPELAGFCGLRSGGIDGDPELLFGLLPRFWRQGLAQEASRAVLGRAFDVLRLPRIAAAADAPNTASARTLGAIGMRLERRGDHHGLETLFFGLDRPGRAGRS